MNYADGPGSGDVRYALLSRLAVEVLNANCTGAYVPGENLLLPNDGSLLRALHQNISTVGNLRLPILKAQ